MISCYSSCLCAIQQSPSIYNNNASNIPNTNINTTRTHILDYSRPSNLQYQAYVPVILFCWLLLIVLSDILTIYKSVLY